MIISPAVIQISWKSPLQPSSGSTSTTMAHSPTPNTPSSPSFSSSSTHFLNGIKTGATQAVLLYPFGVVSTQQYAGISRPALSLSTLFSSRSSFLGSFFWGLAPELAARSLKVGLNFMGLDYAKETLNTHSPLPHKAINFSISGIFIGGVEAILFNPLSVIKSRMQTQTGSSSFIKQLLKLSPSDYFLGLKPVLYRNVTCNGVSCFVLSLFYSHSSDYSPLETRVVGGVSFLIGGLSTVGFESARLNSVLGLTHQFSFAQTVLKLSPGLSKVALMGAVAGPYLKKLFDA